MKPTIWTRFRVEMGFTLLCGTLSLLTLCWGDWIEILTGLDLDHHSGSLERMIIAAPLLLVCVLTSLAARAQWRPPRSAVISET